MWIKPSVTYSLIEVIAVLLFVTDDFRLLTVGNKCVKYVSHLKYLGHIINTNLCDDADIEREIRNMFIRCKIVATRKFYKSSLDVKLTLFRLFCFCFYDTASSVETVQGRFCA